MSEERKMTTKMLNNMARKRVDYTKPTSVCFSHFLDFRFFKSASRSVQLGWATCE